MAQAPRVQATPVSPDANYYRNDGSQAQGATPTDWVEAAGQTFKAGDPVFLSSGKIAIAAAAGNEVPDLGLLGFATNDASGVEDTPVGVRVIRNGDLYAMNMSSGVTAATLKGTRVNFDIYTGSGGNQLCANNGAVASPPDKPYGVIEHLLTPELYPSMGGDAIGDTNGRVVVKMNDHFLQ